MRILRDAFSSTHDSIKIVRSFINLHNSFLTELVEQEIKLTVKTKTKDATTFERTVALKT
jgi:hypothetical protein